MRNDMILINKFTDFNEVLPFYDQKNVDAYLRQSRHKENLAMQDFLGYEVFESLDQAADKFIEAKAIIIQGVLDLLKQLNRLLMPKIKYFRIYAKDKNQKRFSPIGSDCQQVINLMYAVMVAENDLDHVVGIVSKYYEQVEARAIKE